jgi:hypothetical protein
MQRNTFKGRTGASEPSLGEIYDYGQEHYHALLREADQRRLEHRARLALAQGQSALHKSPITRLLMWIGLF